MNETTFVEMSEWQFWVGIILGVIALGVLFYSPSRERRRRSRVEFYRRRRKAYNDALPDRYPYIVGWDGVDPGDLAVIKVGDCSWGVMPMSEALEIMPVHPAAYMDRYVGDGYRSIHQMKGRQ